MWKQLCHTLYKQWQAVFFNIETADTPHFFQC
jgi:hypothetical protein